MGKIKNKKKTKTTDKKKGKYSWKSQTPARTSPANTDTSLRTVCFVPGERKPLYFLQIQIVNTNTLYGPSVSILTELTVIEKVSLNGKAFSPWRHSGEDTVNKQTISPQDFTYGLKS